MGRDSSTVADRVKDKLKMRSRQGCQIGKVELMKRQLFTNNISAEFLEPFSSPLCPHFLILLHRAAQDPCNLPPHFGWMPHPLQCRHCRRADIMWEWLHETLLMSPNWQPWVNNRSGFERFMDFASDNVFLAGGFTGGFFLGIASSWTPQDRQRWIPVVCHNPY